MKKNDWKERLNIVYSTNPNYQYEIEENETRSSLEPDKQKLRVSIDRKNRGGKTVTLVTGFIGTDEELKEIAKLLKNKCGVGGTAKENEIIIQGDFKSRIIEILLQQGYTQTKGSGG